MLVTAQSAQKRAAYRTQTREYQISNQTTCSGPDEGGDYSVRLGATMARGGGMFVMVFVMVW